MPDHHSFNVHAHFYQPSRVDLLTGSIPDEPGAYPYRNWNEKIYEECYRPNAELGNFSKIGFNIGPTLTAWLRNFHPDTLHQIAKADRENFEKFGVGNAIAQSYHHTILPLANRRDKQTQIRWGIYDFERTFGRKPQGMWLPETAVDLETLELLIDNGIQFTILAPWQAAVHDVDTRKAYQVILAGHKSIKVLFYHSGLSSRISFDPNATENADEFIRAYVKPEFLTGEGNQWLTVASDGELYGHHQPFRDKFLSYLLNGSLNIQSLEYSFPALQIQSQTTFPIMQVKENTSWSCHHGVKRWHGVCACTPNSEWKKHLREALERLENNLDRIFEECCLGLHLEPWIARDAYVEVFTGEKRFEEWIKPLAKHDLSREEIAQLRLLFDAQLDGQRMFTSCGWFFEDLDRIEPKNNLAYAAHAVWLVKKATSIDLSLELLPYLERVRSWRSGLTAANVFIQALSRFDGTVS